MQDAKPENLKPLEKIDLENHWGLCLALDVKDCQPHLIRSKETIQEYVAQLCKLIDMKTYGDCHVVHFGTGNKEGFSMFQLIETSNICGHFANDTNTAYIDIFSCKAYDPHIVAHFTVQFFKGESVDMKTFYRG